MASWLQHFTSNAVLTKKTYTECEVKQYSTNPSSRDGDNDSMWWRWCETVTMIPGGDNDSCHQTISHDEIRARKSGPKRWDDDLLRQIYWQWPRDLYGSLHFYLPSIVNWVVRTQLPSHVALHFSHDIYFILGIKWILSIKVLQKETTLLVFL